VPLPQWVTVLVVAVATVVSASCSRLAADGPLTHTGEMGWTDTGDVGDVFADGSAIVRLTDGPVEVVRVSPRLDSEGLEYLGAVMAGPDRSIGGVIDPGWPVDDPKLGDVVEAKGAMLTADASDRTHSYEFILGYRVTSEGRHENSGVDIEYLYESRRYRLFVPVSFVMCAGAAVDGCDEAPAAMERVEADGRL
jgi:hypothetical protein